MKTIEIETEVIIEKSYTENHNGYVLAGVNYECRLINIEYPLWKFGDKFKARLVFEPPELKREISESEIREAYLNRDPGDRGIEGVLEKLFRSRE